jgi:hypothetical protein
MYGTLGWYEVTFQVPSVFVVPPGWYMLFVGDAGMPGVAKWVQIGGDPFNVAVYPGF